MTTPSKLKNKWIPEILQLLNSDWTLQEIGDKFKYIIEVKGYMRDISASKIMMFQELYPELELVIWDKEVIKLIKEDLGLTEKDIKKEFSDNKSLMEVA